MRNLVPGITHSVMLVVVLSSRTCHYIGRVPVQCLFANIKSIAQ